MRPAYRVIRWTTPKVRESKLIRSGWLNPGCTYFVAQVRRWYGWHSLSIYNTPDEAESGCESHAKSNGPSRVVSEFYLTPQAAALLTKERP